MTDIYPMNATEVRQLVTWANDEGWNPGLNDAECFWKLDPDGFLGLSEDGELVGGGAIIRHSASFGFMGLFIVNKPYRGRKLGTRLWFARRDRLLSRLQAGGTIGLDGVDEMVPFYQKGGFLPFTRHCRFQLSTASAKIRRSTDIVDLHSVTPAAVADFDCQCFPSRREQFLTEWVRQTGAVSLGCVQDNQLRGFGVMRPCVTGWKIGPLSADTPEIADGLFQAFQLKLAGQPVFLDVPDNNQQAIALCHKYQMQEVFGCVRMYYGPAPMVDHHRIYGITTLEVG